MPSASRIAAILTAAVLAAGCGLAPPDREFRSLGDFERTVPVTYAGTGNAPRFVAPPGVALASRVEARTGKDGWPTYDLVVTAATRGDADARERIEPNAADAVLIDDEGGRFPCTRLLVPDLEDEPDPKARTWTLVFDLPADYRPAKMLTLIVHWSVDIDGDTYLLTSRFRA